MIAGGTRLATHYQVLNVAPDCEDVVIRAAYRALIGKYHPDKHPEDRSGAEQVAKQINEAYRVLSDPATRAAYDATLQREPHSDRASTKASVPPEPATDSFAEGSGDASAGEPVSATFAKPSSGFKHAWVIVALPLLVLALTPNSTRPAAIQFTPPTSGADTVPQHVEAATAPNRDSTTGVEVLDVAPIATDNPTAAPRAEPQAPEVEPALASSQDEKGFSAAPALPVRPIPSANAHPDLTTVSDQDRRTVELACLLQRQEGVAVYNSCLRTQLRAAASTSHPDVSAVGAEDRRTVELACLLQRSEGPAVYNECLRNQLRSAADHPHPDLSTLDQEDRRTIELACLMRRSDGPARYNACIQRQLRSLGQ